MAELNIKSWFLPDTPDVTGLLREQLSVTIEGVDWFARWANGESLGEPGIREIEARGDDTKRKMLNAIKEAFVMPIEPEDLFSLSRAIDRVLNQIGDLVGESEVLECGPDQGIAEIADLLAQAVRELDTAISYLVKSPQRASDAADQAIAVSRELQGAYYRGMALTLKLDSRGERIARRELYRRSSRIGETVSDIGERVVYSIVKEN